MHRRSRHSPSLVLASLSLGSVTLGSLACAPAATPCPAVAPPKPEIAVHTTPTPTATASASASSAPYAGLGVESVAPELLARHAAKPLPPDASRRIQAMLDVRAPSAGYVSPDGKRLFFGWTVTGTPQIFRLDAPMGFPVQLTGGEDATSLAAVSPDGRWLAVQRDRSGEENPGLYLLSPDGGALLPIQHLPKVQTTFDRFSDDGRSLYYHANDRTPDSYAIYRYDIATKTKELVFGEPGIWSLVDARVTRDGERLLLEKAVGSNMTEAYELDPKTRVRSPIVGQGEREDHVVRYGHGDEVLVLTPKLGEFRRLYAWARDRSHTADLDHTPLGVASPEPVRLVPVTPPIAHDVASVSVDRARKRILYTVNEGGYTRLYALDARTKKPVALPPLPAGDHVAAAGTTPDGARTTVQVDPGTAPPKSYLIDWTKKTTTAWHVPATPEIDTSTFARVTQESYPARDGTKIPMFVRRPAACSTQGGAADAAKPSSGGEPCPVIVSFHGGPEAQAMAGFNARAELFVQAGFVYAEPNVRGSDGYGRTWLHADDGPKRLAVLSDIEDAAIHARKAFAIGGVAPKVGVFGGSYGGYATLAAMTIFAGAYDAGVSVVGISSLTTFLANTAPYRRALRISEYGDPEKDRDALERLSPIRSIEKLQAPLLLIQGATDPRVPVGEATQFYDAMQKKGLPGELILFPDEGHGMRKRSNQVLALGHTLRFFETHLKGAAKR